MGCMSRRRIKAEKKVVVKKEAPKSKGKGKGKGKSKKGK